MLIRPFVSSDLDTMQAITVEGFDGIAIDQLLEQRFGILHNHDWKYRKAMQVAEDCRLHPQGVFVAELHGSVVGYISTRIEPEIGKGRIPNLAVDKRVQGQGIGRKLIEHALAYFRREGLSFAMIETMAINPVGQHLYPACGFSELGRQIHYGMRLVPEGASSQADQDPV